MVITKTYVRPGMILQVFCQVSQTSTETDRIWDSDP